MQSRRTIRSRVTAIIAVLLTIGATTFGAASSASAAASVMRCSDWEHEKSLPTNTTWGRLMNRVCIRWVPNGNQVRAEAQIRVDWPAKYCEPPWSSVACAVKIPKVKFDEMHVRLDYALPSRLGPARRGTCHWGASAYLPPGAGYVGARTRACATSYRAHPWGRFFVRATIDYRIGGSWYSTGNTPSSGAGWWSVNFPRP